MHIMPHIQMYYKYRYTSYLYSIYKYMYMYKCHMCKYFNMYMFTLPWWTFRDWNPYKLVIWWPLGNSWVSDKREKNVWQIFMCKQVFPVDSEVYDHLSYLLNGSVCWIHMYIYIYNIEWLYLCRGYPTNVSDILFVYNLNLEIIVLKVFVYL